MYSETPTLTDKPITIEGDLLHHQGSFDKLMEAQATDPLVRAVFALFQRPECKLSWAATLEYLAANLLERSQGLEMRLEAMKEKESQSRIILSS